MKIISAFFLLSLSLLPGIARADVFKCKVGGSTVYQSLPCDGKAEATPYLNTSSSLGGSFKEGSAHSMTLREIYTAMQAESKLRRKIVDENDQDMKALRRDDSVGRQRIVALFMAKLEAHERRSTELSSELRRRCPGGASLNETTVSCRK